MDCNGKAQVCSKIKSILLKWKKKSPHLRVVRIVVVVVAVFFFLWWGEISKQSVYVRDATKAAGKHRLAASNSCEKSTRVLIEFCLILYRMIKNFDQNKSTFVKLAFVKCSLKYNRILYFKMKYHVYDMKRN